MNTGDKAELKEKIGQAIFSSHRFPILQTRDILSDGGRNNTCNRFQPLYGCNHLDSKSSQNGKETSASGRTRPDPVMAARGMAFEAGYCVGSREARDAVKKSLIPDLESFLSTVEDLAAFQSLVAETAATRVVELAFVMAELITGVPPSLDGSHLEAFQSELETDIYDAYQMILIFHPEDDQSFRQAFTYCELHWTEHKAIVTETDNHQPRNQISAKIKDKCFENHAAGKLTPHLNKDVKPSTS